MKSCVTVLRARGLSTLLVASCVILLMHLVVPGAGVTSTTTNAPASVEEFRVTTVFLIRHAEKADAPREDPPLDDKGKLRSQELARMLGQAGIKAIYTSQFLRTKQTAEPIALRLGLTPTAIPIKMSQSNPREVSAQSIAEITGKIKERAGETALVIGHSNTIPEVIKMLGGDLVPAIDEKKFDDLFIVTVYGKGTARVIHLKYGRSD